MAVCKKCVLPEEYPGISFDKDGVCNYCNKFRSLESTQQMDFDNENELIYVLQKYKDLNRDYDVLVPLSGGVDSSFALINIVEKFKLKPLVYHNDHGYEDATATENVKKLCKALNVDLIICQQDLEFMKKLWKYSNEANVKGLSCCYVCGNILFMNSIKLADRFNIPIVINGYSKGQASMVNDTSGGIELLEKQVEIFSQSGDKEFFYEFMNKYKILEKKTNYQTREDLERRPDSNKILVIPFYIFKFYKSDKELLRNEITKRFNWRPLKYSYPNRTTNCEMVWLNTYMDMKKMHYSMYHTEYSELVRSGEISRMQAICDLEFNPPEEIIERLAKEINVDINKFYTPSSKGETEPSYRNKIDVEFDL